MLQAVLPLLAATQLQALCPSCQIVVGNVRVQALSPTLLRVEPKGPRGFEDRGTFMVVNRSFAGVEASARATAGGGTNISTAFYSVLLRRNGSFAVNGADGRPLYSAAAGHAAGSTRNLLHWPAPLKAEAYALEDRPRFVPPLWAPEPAPAGAAHQATSGYDFENQVKGDVYVFLLGDRLSEWWDSRAEFLSLTGPTPLLPDYAYGTWYTRWHQYNETAVKAEINCWNAGKFPLDVWGLDMNWRRTNGTFVGAPACHSQASTDTACEDHKYLVNTTDFPQAPHAQPLEEWLQWMSGEGVHTYLNDHPFPRGEATTPKEAAFRWDSLTGFLSRGLSFWWFDHGWIFSLPPPFVAVNDTSSFGKFPGPWEGLTSEVWGSHVYYDVSQRFNAASRTERPLALSRNGGTNWLPGMDNSIVNGVAAHHRYPVWWNGDGVPIMGSVSSMAEESIHDFRPFVHSDCGAGQTFDNATAVMRWTAHCVLGTILRFHGADHSPWRFDTATQAVLRSYLQMRYALAPSLVAAGRITQRQGLPLAARCDLFWPTHDAARSSTQYISTFAESLVAPLNETQMSRSVWIPPGEWQETWSGKPVTGPRTINVTRPWDKIPMWHRVGALVITTDSKALRIAAQDWHHLTMHAWPTSGVAHTSKDLYLGDSNMSVALDSDGAGAIRVRGTALAAGGTADDAVQTWLLRLHLPKQCKLSDVTVDGATLAAPVRHLEPADDCAEHFPFAGAGATPACQAGSIVEVEIKAGKSAWSVRATMQRWPSRSKTDDGGADVATVAGGCPSAGSNWSVYPSHCMSEHPASGRNCAGSIGKGRCPDQGLEACVATVKQRCQGLPGCRSFSIEASGANCTRVGDRWNRYPPDALRDVYAGLWGRYQ